MKKIRHKGRERIVPVPDRLTAKYSSLTRIHPEIKGKALIVKRNNFYIKFRELCKRVETLNELAHPHILRHIKALEIVRAGVPINAVKLLLGHSGLNTTAMYLHHSATDINDIL